MAKRRSVERKVSLRPTPTSKGAHTSTQRAAKTAKAAITPATPLPWAVRPPKPTNDEDNLYSQGVVVSRNRGRHADAVAAAQQRMQGRLDDDDTEDVESADDIDENADDTMDDGTDDELQDGAQDDNTPASIADLAALLQAFQTQQQPSADFEQRVQEEVAKRLQPQPVTSGFIAPAPAPTSAPSTFLAIHRVTDEDVDRLWDWLRADPGSAQAFFANLPKTSMQLQSIIAALHNGEAAGVGMIRSLRIERTQGPLGTPLSEHIGFAMAAPMFTDEKIAMLHIYLSSNYRGQLQQMLPSFLDLAAQELPSFRFAVMPNGAAQLRLYGALLPPLGFTTHTMFVR